MRNGRKSTINREATEQMLAEGIHSSIIAAKYGVSAAYIDQIRRAMGIKFANGPEPGSRWPEDKQVALAEMLALGYSASKIGRALGVSRFAVLHQRKRLIEPAKPRKPEPVPEPRAASLPPLSPAMRNLAKFDSILAARLQKEEGAEAPSVIQSPDQDDGD